MPRAKRTHSQTLETTITTEPCQSVPEEPLSGDQARPKRVRKQTEKFSSTVTQTVTRTRKTKTKVTKPSQRKGKKKATVNEQEVTADAVESALPGAGLSEPSKESRAKAPTKEKRLAQFKPECPQKIMERAERVRTQRFFMIDRKREGKELKEEFKVLGSTANVYTVTVDYKPKCDCPDNRMGNHCKHIMFVFLKVLCVPISSHIWYQKALLTSELDSVFAAAPVAPNSVTNPRVREAFLRATGQVAETSASGANSKRRIPGEEDDCPICYDTMFEVAETSLHFCEECGNALHKECFSQYEKSARNTGKAITCVWCRSSWGVVEQPKPKSTPIHRGLFINLADAVPGA